MIQEPKLISTGKGPLFVPANPDGYRAHQRQRNRGQVSKLMSVGEAIDRFVRDGSYITTGGFGASRIPNALLHESVRKRVKDLGFCGLTTTHDYQVLVAGDCIRRVDAAYIVGLEARGLSPNARRAHQEGRIEVCEWSNASLAWRLQAGAMGIPFLPTYVNAGTDTYNYSAACTITCPFTGRDVILLPALNPDVALIHVHKADAIGNCEIKGITVADFDSACASKTTLVTCEELVPTDYFREEPTRTTIPWMEVDAVVVQKYGSYPGNMAGCYFSDEDHLREWLKAEKDPATLAAFLDKFVFGCASFEEYLEKCGGATRLQALEREERIGEATT